MKYGKLLGIASVLGSLVYATGVQALPITGSISFGGTSATFDSPDLASATAFLSVTDPIVVGGTGTYAQIFAAGNGVSSVDFPNHFSFVGNVLNPNPLQYLWTVTDNLGNTYKFEADSVKIDEQNGSVLSLSGTGYALANGFDKTAGTWTISATTAGQTYAFVASTAVPDGGSTAALLGGVLFLLFAYRQKLMGGPELKRSLTRI